jgi:hypothetical protein
LETIYPEIAALCFTGSNPVLTTKIKNMKIKIEIVDDQLNPISDSDTKYIDVENYQHTKDFHTNSVLEEMADEILLDIKWRLEKLK